MRRFSDSGFYTSSENYKELLNQAEAIIDDIRSNSNYCLSKDLKTIGSSLDIILRLILLTNFLYKSRLEKMEEFLKLNLHFYDLLIQNS